MDVGHPSFWLDEVGHTRPAPLASGRHAVDALVVGLGLTGASAALELAEAGLDVLAVDAHGLGWGASARSGGFLLVENVCEYPARRARLGKNRMRTLIRMSQENHREIETRFAQAAEHRRCGSLMLPMLEDPDEQATLEQAAGLLRADGVACEAGVEHALLRGFAPGLAIPEDGEVHPGRLLAAIGRDASGCGARLRRARVLDLDAGSCVARTETGAIEYGIAIIAVNAWTRQLFPDVDVQPQRAQMLATRPAASVRSLGPVCYAGWGFDYFRQRDDGRVLVGGRRNLHRETEATDISTPTPPVQHDLEAYLAAHLPTLGPFEVDARWSGIMGFSPDGLPLWRPIPDARGKVRTHVVGGMTGHGMGLGAVCGQTIAAHSRGDLGPERAPYLDLLHVRRVQAIP